MSGELYDLRIIEAALKEQLAEANLCPHRNYEPVEARLEQIEERIAELEGQL